MSKRICRPIQHRDAHSAEIERELVAWFREAVFLPLVLVMEEHKGVVRENEAGEWLAFSPSVRPGLNLPRNEVPQIDARHLADFRDWLVSEGVDFEMKHVPAANLAPSQNGYWSGKIKAVQAENGVLPVLVGSDNCIVDGHHRWYAAYLHDPETYVPCIRFSKPASWLIAKAFSFPKVRRENEAPSGALIAALSDGSVSYVNDRFIGTFSAAVARELRLFGARYQAGSFVIPISSLPYYVRAKIADSLSRGKAAHAAVLAFLASALANIESSPETVDAAKPAFAVIGDLSLQFRETFADVEMPLFTSEDRRKLTEELTQRLDLAIRGVAAERLPELRRRVELNLAARGDTNTLAALLEHEFGVVKTRAKQIAEHETALLISKYRQIRYESAGVQSYVWETKQDERVRPGHSALHGREFLWSNPPIVDTATGRRCHPGEDYNCRCAPLPVLSIPSSS